MTKKENKAERGENGTAMHQDHTEVKVMLTPLLPLVEIRPGYYGNLDVKLLDVLVTLSVYGIFTVLYVFILYNEKIFAEFVKHTWRN